MKAMNILEADSHHKEALFIGGMSELNLRNYIQSLKYFNKLIQKDPTYNQTAFLGSVICFNAIRKHK